MANFELSTRAGRKAARKALKRRLARTDFPTDEKGWKWFCDYRIDIDTRNQNRAARNLEYWKKVKAGEHLVAAMAKVDATTQLMAEAEAAKKEVEALKAQLAALQQPKPTEPAPTQPKS